MISYRPAFLLKEELFCVNRLDVRFHRDFAGIGNDDVHNRPALSVYILYKHYIHLSRIFISAAKKIRKLEYFSASRPI